MIADGVDYWLGGWMFLSGASNLWLGSLDKCHPDKWPPGHLYYPGKCLHESTKINSTLTQVSEQEHGQGVGEREYGQPWANKIKGQI